MQTIIDRFEQRVIGLLGGNVAINADIIHLPEYADAAEMRIKRYVPNHAKLTGDKQLIFESCIVYQTAINLFDYTRQNVFKSEQNPYMKTERFENDRGDVNTLIAMLDELLAQISEQYIAQQNIGSSISFVLTSPVTNSQSVY